MHGTLIYLHFMSLKLNPCLFELLRAFQRNSNAYCKGGSLNVTERTKMDQDEPKWTKMDKKGTKNEER